MSESYRVYGLTVQANSPIPGLNSIRAAHPVDLDVQLGLEPPWLPEIARTQSEITYTSLGHDELADPGLRVWKLCDGEYFLFRYADETQFVIDCRATEIWATWPGNLTVEDTATYLLGPIIGFALLLRGTISLHASAVAVQNQAIALLGPAGAGKSTTAAAFANLGYKILSDDVLTLVDRDHRFFVQPAYPCIRLWPSSVEALYGEPDALPLLTPNWDKRYLDLNANGYRFQEEPLPLAAIYIFSGRRNDSRAPFIVKVTQKEGLLELISNTYVNYLMDTTMCAHDFRILSRLSSNTLFRRAIPHSEPRHVSKLCDVILEDFQRESRLQSGCINNFGRSRV